MGTLEALTEIHRGPRFVVSRALLLPEGRPVVCKSPRADGPNPHSAAARIEREYQLLARLDLAGVVRALALERIAGRPALVLEDAGPQTLGAWQQRRPLPLEGFFAIALPLTETLGRLHQHGVIHRDLSPANVIIDAELRLTLIDFDSATSVAFASEHATVPPRRQATLAYIAPEETGRMNRLVDHRADLYSLGAIFYELLTGGPPFAFASTDPLELVHAHLARAPVPLTRVNPALPVSLSDLVQRLLAKMPEERYQSALSVLADLRELERRARAGPQQEPFELGLADLALALPLPDHLYQREGERGRLRHAWQRAASGESMIALVSGAAGVGKTALVKELLPEVAQRRGRTATARFDAGRASTPYAAFAEAFRILALAELDGPIDEAERFAGNVSRALGPNLRVLTDLCPELAPRLGPAPPLPPLGPFETEHRFVHAVSRFLAVLATRERPLLLFLDDAEGADPASLRLLPALAQLAVPYLLLVVATRDADLAAAGPALPGMRQAGIARCEIALAPLDEAAVAALCQDALHCDYERARPLAALLVRKTAGNPLFLRRLLRFLQQSSLLVYGGDPGTWSWDLEALRAVEVTDNVVDLLTASLQRLPAKVLRLVQVAACIGARVPLPLMAALQVLPHEDAADDLQIAVEEGYLERNPPEHPAEGTSFQFVHAKVREAAYALLGQDDRKAIHLSIGRQLLRFARGPRPERGLTDIFTELPGRGFATIFSVTDQLNLGADLITEPDERQRLLNLNRMAARAARSTSAFVSALQYLKRGIALLPTGAQHEHRALAFSLHRDALECAYVAGDEAQVAESFAGALGHASSRIERADLYNLHVSANLSLGAGAVALRWGEEALRELGVEVVAGDLAAAATAELDAVAARIGNRSANDLAAAGSMERVEELALMRLYASIIGAAFVGHPMLHRFLVARMVRMSLEHGYAPSTAIAFVFYALILRELTGDYARAHAFGALGLELGARFGATEECKTLAIYPCHLQAWFAPMADALPMFRLALVRGREAGEQLYSESAPLSIVMLVYYLGVPLERVVGELEQAESDARRSNRGSALRLLGFYRDSVRQLQGRGTPDPAVVEALVSAARSQVTSWLAIHLIRLLELAYLFGDAARAQLYSELAQPASSTLRMFALEVEHVYYTALTLLERAPSLEPEARAAAVARARQLLAQLQVWEGFCPANHAQKVRLVAAELARVEGEQDRSAQLYDQAVECAHRAEALNDEALACERAGRFHRGGGRRHLARRYFGSAVEAWARYGAHGKVDALLEEFPELRDQRSHGSTPLSEPAYGLGATLDRMVLFRAAEAIAGEVVLERLLGKLMEVCLATAGAERGVFVLEEDGQLYVRAVAQAGMGLQPQRTPLTASAEVPHHVIEDVRRSMTPLVVADATHDRELGRDAYVTTRGVRSLLALPVTRRGRSSGVLYLENNLVTHVFTPDRVRLLQLLSSQLAISVENSLMYEGLRREIEERKRAEGAARFLADAGAALVESLDYRATMTRVARLSVGWLCDWCTIDTMDDGVMRRKLAAHREPDKEALLLEFRRLQERNGPPRTHLVADTGKPLLLPEVSEQMGCAFAGDAELMGLLERIGIRSVMVLPLRARDRAIGAITLVSGGERRYGAADLALAQDLTRRAAIAMDNARLYDDAQEAIRLREDFLSIASHELNTPIASLQLTAQSLEDLYRGPLAERARLVQIILRQVRRLHDLVTQLLDVTRIHTGALRLRREPLDLGTLAQETVDRLSEDAARAGCHIEVHASLPVVGRWDRMRIEQVIGNLLSNAIKFSGAKPIVITVSQAADQARLVVEDQGIGIPGERLPHIFGRFERAVSSAHYGGLGLGLFIVSEIVSALGGRAEVESEVGVGSRFTIEIPLDPRDKSAAA